MEQGWDDLEALLEGRAPIRQMRWDSSESGADEQQRWELADLSALRAERVRDFGEGWLALSLSHRLGLHRLLSQLIEAGKEEVGWEQRDIVKSCVWTMGAPLLKMIS